MEKVKWIILILVLCMAAGAGVCYWYLPQAHAADENLGPVLEEGQEYAYAKITSILGNEMEYVIVDAKTVDFDVPQEQNRERRAHDDSENVRGGMPPRDIAEGTDKSAVQKLPSRDAADHTQDTVVMTYIETDEAGQMQIPVGTEVETKLGAVTTFSRLSNGDIIKMLLQSDGMGKKELMKIWIVE
ncbi:MAG: hypothetical protein K2O40_10065 [Lachnospiraceae bacterium]|nr:hypothetical protein [Lachnospiraceae bacterium]MDE7184797.1 hypothetical protein [Lachnospiraceae bacterium]